VVVMSERDETEMLMQAMKPIVFLVQQIPTDHLDSVIRVAERYDTIGPILDPTAWQRTHRNVAEHAVLLRALRTFRRTIDEIGAREMERAGVQP
jgi:hypothetical protein